MKRPLKLRPSQGGVFAPPHGNPVTNDGLTCRSCGYHVCACSPSEPENDKTDDLEITCGF